MPNNLKTAFCKHALPCLLIVSASLYSCENAKQQDGPDIFNYTETQNEEQFDLTDIQNNGELIILTLYGPYSFFEFRGENFGYQYKLAEEYAKSIGVCLRVEVCRSVNELKEKLADGYGDIIACATSVSELKDADLSVCGEDEITQFMDSIGKMQKDNTISGQGKTAWAVRKSSQELEHSLDSWLKDNKKLFFDISLPRTTTGGRSRTYVPRMNVHSPIRSVAKGIISDYDHLFKKYSRECGWDWRLMAAQSYQESGFDAQAVSWMGAMGLMQLMPSTARTVNVAENEIFSPEANIRGASAYIRFLKNHYADIADENERTCFVLAAYNAGPGHVDDARRLAWKSGKRTDVWKDNVDKFVLCMSESRYYNDPVVEHGYFRGSETFNYVNSILARWHEYRTKIKH